MGYDVWEIEKYFIFIEINLETKTLMISKNGNFVLNYKWTNKANIFLADKYLCNIYNYI